MGYGFITQPERDSVIGYKLGIPIKQNLQGKYLDWTSPQGYKIPIYEDRPLPNAPNFYWGQASDEQLQNALDGYTTWLSAGGATESNLVQNAAVSALQVAPLVYGLGALGAGTAGAGAAGGGGIGTGLGAAGGATTGVGIGTGGALTGLGAAGAELTNVGIGSGAGMGTGGVPATFSTGPEAAGGIPATFSTGASQMGAAAGAAPSAATGAGGLFSSGLTQTGRELVHGTPGINGPAEGTAGASGAGIGTDLGTAATSAGVPAAVAGGTNWIDKATSLAPVIAGATGVLTGGSSGGGGGGTAVPGAAGNWDDVFAKQMSAADVYGKRAEQQGLQELIAQMKRKGIYSSGITDQNVNQYLSDVASRKQAAADSLAFQIAQAQMGGNQFNTQLAYQQQQAANEQRQQNETANWNLMLAGLNYYQNQKKLRQYTPASYSGM